ncbi:MAG TPA: endolytic transglycosylase MltG, partial [Anaerolineales bacterium]|nr:endolytic transglycosylase MltG [Anaerolineales bacterium]
MIGLMALLAVAAIPFFARRYYGGPAAWLTLPQVVEYSAKLLWADGTLTTPFRAGAGEVEFEVQSSEPVDSVCARLEQAGIVADAGTMRDYLIYTGQDRSLQAGRYRVSAAMSAIDVARRMQDATPQDVDFVVLPGWRIEEIAASLPTSGLPIATDDFIRAANAPRGGYDFLEGADTLEGFLFPDAYVLPRDTGIDRLLDTLLSGFEQHVSAELRDKVGAQGLTIREAVILASIVQREAVDLGEAPLIASVYLNRLRTGMDLEADPTVQYALGFNTAQQTWWTNPLTLADLSAPSPYNTYQWGGLPPG